MAATWVTHSAEETQQLAEKLGSGLQAGDVLALRGTLGSGKTTFVQGLVRGMGASAANVKSPTFVLVREYAGPTPVVHIDAYRLAGSPAAAWLDVEQLFQPDKIVVVEWAQRMEVLLPDERIDVELEHVSTHRRRITLGARGGRAAALARRLEGIIHGAVGR